MPRRSLVLEENQPSIKTLLPNCLSCTEPKCTQHDSLTPKTTCDSDTELINSKNTSTAKKRKRKNRPSRSPNDKPNKKSLTKTPVKMAKPEETTPPLSEDDPNNPNPSPTSCESKIVQLSPELEELERRLNNNMLQNIASSIEAALQPIKDSIDRILTSSDLIAKQEEEINTLKEENVKLQEDLTAIRTDMNGLKSRLNDLENKALESNLIFRGLKEELNETDEGLKEKIYWNIADTMDRYDQNERLALAHTFTIRRCRRLGKPNPSRSRPVSVEFDRRADADAIYEYRYHLTGGLYVDREFNPETENSRRILRPILRAAKMKPEYRYKSRMENDKLVIDSKRYGINDLNQLPQKLHPFEVTTKSNEETLGFFGELCPFSNFFPVQFTHEGIKYHSSEQLIQYKKAVYCGDKTTAVKILGAKNAISCKQLAYQIQNYDHRGWIDAANELCRDGIHAKFDQNPSLSRKLLSTGEKTLVESSRDDIWGTGVPLFRWDCLNRIHWKGNGILGALLEDIRDSLRRKNTDYQAMETTVNTLPDH